MGLKANAARIMKGDTGIPPMVEGLYAAQLVDFTTSLDESRNTTKYIITVCFDKDCGVDEMAGREEKITFNAAFNGQYNQVGLLIALAGADLSKLPDDHEFDKQQRYIKKLLTKIALEEPMLELAVVPQMKGGEVKRSDTGRPYFNIFVKDCDTVLDQADEKPTVDANLFRFSDEYKEKLEQEQKEAKRAASQKKKGKQAPPLPIDNEQPADNLVDDEPTGSDDEDGLDELDLG